MTDELAVYWHDKKRGTFMRKHSLSLVTIAVIAVSGCASIGSSVQKRLASNDFNGALAQLEKAGAGMVPAADVKPDALAARATFQAAVEKFYGEKSASLLGRGFARAALAEVAAGQQRCRWSPRLNQELGRLQTVVRGLDEAQAKWEPILKAPGLTAENARQFLAEVAPDRSPVADSPLLVELTSVARGAIAEAVGTDIARGGNAWQADLVLLGVPKPAQEALVRDVDAVRSLPLATQLQGNANSQVGQIRKVISSLSSERPKPLQPGHRAMVDVFSTWANQVLAVSIAGGKDYAAVEIGEEALAALGSMNPQPLRSALANAHISRARVWHGQGNAAWLSLLHLARAQQLGAQPSEVGDSLAVTHSALQGAATVNWSISVDLPSAGDPEAGNLIRLAIRAEIEKRTQGKNTWTHEDPVHGKPAQVQVTIESADSPTPSRRSLRTVQSRYLSHFESVPNPRKQTLRNQLSFEQIRVDGALASLNGAIASHNAFPTEYSLMNVNSARSNYLMALNSYNGLVDVYNATPATVQEPVHLPYSFVEGNVASGFSGSFKIKVGKSEVRTSRSSVDKDFVRIGSKYNDVDPSYRRDDRLDLDLSFDRRFTQLMEVASAAVDALETSVADIVGNEKYAFSDGEKLLYRWLTHPFGPSVRVAGLPAWAGSLRGQLALPSFDQAVPPVVLSFSSSNARRDLSAKAAAEWFIPLVCRTLSGSGNRTSSGSGILVSGDGLILTCAHVITGSANKVVFSNGPLKGTYPADVVFLNERMDVALIKARGLTSDRWAQVRLSGPAQAGERLVAIGNPSLNAEDTAVGAITEGIVSSPDAEALGRRALVASVTVASGSSGGPLISLETGEVVGVVQAVTSKGIVEGEGRDATDFFTLAAPAARLRDWLGLQNGQQGGN